MKENKEPPPITKEERKMLENYKYAGGSTPLHFFVAKEADKCRIDFIAPALDPAFNVCTSAGVNGYVVVGKRELTKIAAAANAALELLG